MFDDQSLRRISQTVQKVERQSFNALPRQKSWPTVAAADAAESGGAITWEIQPIPGANELRYLHMTPNDHLEIGEPNGIARKAGSTASFDLYYCIAAHVTLDSFEYGSVRIGDPPSENWNPTYHVFQRTLTFRDKLRISAVEIGGHLSATPFGEYVVPVVFVSRFTPELGISRLTYRMPFSSEGLGVQTGGFGIAMQR